MDNKIIMIQLSRTTMILFVLFTFFGCENGNKESSNKKAVVADTDFKENKSDTFYYHYMSELKMYDRKISQEFFLDTINHVKKRTKTDEYLVIPRINTPLIDKRLKTEFDEIKNIFAHTNSNLMIDESSKKYIDGNSVEMQPVNLYKTDRLISCCFELCYSDSVLMRPYCHYDCINYDIELNRKIKFSDYFEIKSAEDSAFIGQLILSAVGERNFIRQLRLDNSLDFSINEEYVFFYFDAYELSAPFNIGGGIKKKYLKKFIKEPYQ